MIGSAAHLSFADFLVNTGTAVLLVILAAIICFHFIYGKDLMVEDRQLRKLCS
jgi:Na+/H+ antiporter NhaD/arsenite permease-like protein